MYFTPPPSGCILLPWLRSNLVYPKVFGIFWVYKTFLNVAFFSRNQEWLQSKSLFFFF